MRSSAGWSVGRASGSHGYAEPRRRRPTAGGWLGGGGDCGGGGLLLGGGLRGGGGLGLLGGGGLARLGGGGLARLGGGGDLRGGGGGGLLPGVAGFVLLPSWSLLIPAQPSVHSVRQAAGAEVGKGGGGLERGWRRRRAFTSSGAAWAGRTQPCSTAPALSWRRPARSASTPQQVRHRKQAHQCARSGCTAGRAR